MAQSAHQQAERLQAESAQRLEMFEREGKQPLASKSPAQPKAARRSVGLQDFDRSDSESDEETAQDGDGSPSADTSSSASHDCDDVLWFHPVVRGDAFQASAVPSTSWSSTGAGRHRAAAEATARPAARPSVAGSPSRRCRRSRTQGQALARL